MKKSEFTDEWQDVLIPAKVKRDIYEVSDYLVVVVGTNPDEYGGQDNSIDGYFVCNSYRHFKLVPRGSEVATRLRYWSCVTPCSLRNRP